MTTANKDVTMVGFHGAISPVALRHVEKLLLAKPNQVHKDDILVINQVAKWKLVRDKEIKQFIIDMTPKTLAIKFGNHTLPNPVTSLRQKKCPWCRGETMIDCHPCNNSGIVLML
jgi:hypothetical protein